MAHLVKAKFKRSVKAAAVSALALGLVLSLAKPLLRLTDADAPLDSAPPIYMDLEAEHSLQAELAGSDSEIEDRAQRPVDSQVRVQSGDTLIETLIRGGIDMADAVQAVDSIKQVFNLRTLKAGQTITLTHDKPGFGFGSGPFQKISLSPDPMREVAAWRGKDGFEAGETKRQISKQWAHFAGTIRSSLFESAQSAGVPAQIIIAMIKALSYDVDFQRDIQSGDGFEVMFEGFYDTKGKLVRAGDMTFAAVTLSGKPIAMYRFDPEGGSVEYFNEKGESVKKALLKTPVDGAKITSGFGMRTHPILGFSKMHKGIDFGVPTGTPIQAAGDGTVDLAGFNGSYGNYVRLRHGNGFATAYAHMSRIAQGIHAGRRVSQGQIIGFVGSTGRSTGAHLHYEVLQGSNQINPLSVKMPHNVKLAGRDMDRFKTAKRDIDQLLAKTPIPQRIAATGKPGAQAN